MPRPRASAVQVGRRPTSETSSAATDRHQRRADQQQHRAERDPGCGTASATALPSTSMLPTFSRVRNVEALLLDRPRSRNSASVAWKPDRDDQRRAVVVGQQQRQVLGVARGGEGHRAGAEVLHALQPGRVAVGRTPAPPRRRRRSATRWTTSAGSPTIRSRRYPASQQRVRAGPDADQHRPVLRDVALEPGKLRDVVRAPAPRPVPARPRWHLDARGRRRRPAAAPAPGA